MSNSLVLTDKDATEPFSRDKLLISLYDSLRHRKTAIDDATALTNTIVGQLINKNTEAAISKSFVTSVVLSVLEKFDAVSAVHYNAYYG